MPLVHHLAHRVVHALHGWARRVGDITPDSHLAAGFGRFGRGSAIGFPTETLFGTSGMHIGDDTLIGRDCALSVGYGPGQDPMPEVGLVIGDRCVIGARACITAHSEIVIGDDVWFGKDVFVSDASHGYTDPGVPIGHQLGEHQPVSIGAGSWIGHGAIVLPGTTIGRNVVVAAGSVVRGTVEDHAIVAGVPARVVRRLEPGVGWGREDGRHGAAGAEGADVRRVGAAVL